MNILFHLHAYPNTNLSGAEMMAHRIAKFLQSKGHNIKVINGSCNNNSVFEGIEVIGFNLNKNDHDLWLWADVVVTHLVNTHYCLNQARKYNKKLIHLIHNSFRDHILKVRENANYLVYNSDYVRRILGYNHPYTICIPPVNYRDYEVNNKGSYITLVNLNENKGGRILIEIAKKLPEYKFLAIEGGYYDQIKDESVKNIKYMPPQVDMKKIYNKTKLLLMPSEYESWGQVAIEAISSGVPVLSSEAQGLKEALGNATISIDRKNIDAWVKYIKVVMEDSAVYSKLQELSILRAKELDPLPYLERLNTFFEQVKNVKSWKQ